VNSTAQELRVQDDASPDEARRRFDDAVSAMKATSAWDDLHQDVIAPVADVRDSCDSAVRSEIPAQPED